MVCLSKELKQERRERQIFFLPLFSIKNGKNASKSGARTLVWEYPGGGDIDSLIEQARAAFHANAQKHRADRYRIVFKPGWVKVGKPFMVRSQEEEFVIWVEGGGVEDFRLDQIASMELLPHADNG